MHLLPCRPAQIEDVAAIDRLVNSAYRGEVSKQGWTTEADLLDGQRTDPELLKDTISKPDNVILLFEVENELLGCVYLRKQSEKAYLGMLTVRPQLQNAGLGKSILLSAEQWAELRWAVKSIEMTVIQKRTELIAWYERRGYVNTGRVEPFPYGNEKFGIPKMVDLEFVVLEKKL